jgi:hypothetical protein
MQVSKLISDPPKIQFHIMYVAMLPYMDMLRSESKKIQTYTQIVKVKWSNQVMKC